MSTIPNEWVEGVDYELVDGMDLLKEWREGNEAPSELPVIKEQALEDPAVSAWFNEVKQQYAWGPQEHGQELEEPINTEGGFDDCSTGWEIPPPLDYPETLRGLNLTSEELEDWQMSGLIPMRESNYGDRHTAASE